MSLCVASVNSGLSGELGTVLGYIFAVVALLVVVGLVAVAAVAGWRRGRAGEGWRWFE